jgi:hypothetical protein
MSLFAYLNHTLTFSQETRYEMNTLRISVQTNIRICILHTFSSHQIHIFCFKDIHTIPYNTQCFDMCGVY